MKKIYIMFSHTGTNFSKFLKVSTQSPYTHVSIALDKDFKRLYSFGRESLSEHPLQARFVHEKIDDGVYKELAHRAVCCIYEVKVSEEQYRKAEEILKVFKRKCKASYNFLGILFIPLRITFRPKDKFVCSQFIAYILNNAGIMDFGKHVNLITPNDILNKIVGKKIYEGYVRDYFKVTLPEEVAITSYVNVSAAR